MRRDIVKVRDAFAVVDDLYVVLALLLAANDRDVLRTGVDGVLDELGDGLQRVILRERDDGDHAPMVADL